LLVKEVFPGNSEGKRFLKAGKKIDDWEDDC
jgi:hypothetical protein